MRAKLRDKAALPISQLLDLSFARQSFRRGRHGMTRGTLFDRRVHSDYRRARSRRPLPRCFDGKSIASLISSLRRVFVSRYVEPFQLAVYRLL
jgi:hypothetical protein